MSRSSKYNSGITDGDRSFILFWVRELKVHPTIFKNLGGAKGVRTSTVNYWNIVKSGKPYVATEEAWIYQIVLTDTGPRLARLFV